MGAHEKKSRHIFKTVCLVMLFIIISVFAFSASYVLGIEEWKTFEPDSVSDMELSLKLYSSDGTEYLSLFGSQRRKYISIENIPSHVKNAFLAIEDARFYSHAGIDIVRIFGALFEDLKSGSIKQGASTISQQLIKLTSLSEEQTPYRKMAEIMMALKLESRFSKDEILEMYLNYVYFGAGAYGIETAAQTYFSKSASELSIAEAALLAGVLKSPSNYAPHINMEKSLERQSIVLSAMLENGFITENEYASAKSEKIALNMSEEDEYKYGYYTDMVLSEAEEILGVSSLELLSGGYSIYTSLNAELQSTVETIFENSGNFPENADDGTPVECALIAINPNTGEIIATMGGREHTARRAFNRATSMARQPGSTIKPVLVYAPALEFGGYTAASFVLDEPINIDGYAPENAGGTYHGNITLREAAALSLNIPAIRIFSDIGINTGIDYASSVGIPFSSEDYNLSVVLGGFTTGVSPLQLCSAYQPFANGGYYSSNYCITKILNSKGETVYEADPEKYSVLSEETAFLISSILHSCVEEGTAKRLNLEGITLSAKTGTSGYGNTLNKDAWVVAYNSDYIICCWMGFDRTDEEHVMDKGVTGGTYPSELVSQIFTSLYENSDAPVFEIPSGIESVRLDKNILEKKHEAVRASIFAKESDCVYEYFAKGTAPKAEAEGDAPSDFSATAEDDGIKISFTPTNSEAEYVIVRKHRNNWVKLAYFSGTEVQEYTDTSAIKNTVYTYAVVPYIKINGKYCEGEPSEQITVLAV